MPLWYILALNQNTLGNTLDLTNQFYESNQFADVDPAFMLEFKFDSEIESQSISNINLPCTNDTNFGELWGLNNSINPAIDINACQAWTISQGADVRVAVVDQGIEMGHNDLSDNIDPYSFNTQYWYDSDEQPYFTESVFRAGNNHGTHVAGIIAAVKDNNYQVVGVAPQSKIMGISNDFGSVWPSTDYQLSLGIEFAYQYGAHIINNSWGSYQDSSYHSSLLESAITDAMTLGRDGLGTLIVFASGNSGENGANYMGYPGNFNDDIIVVGANDSSGHRSIWTSQVNPTHESCYGTKLDVVAPGTSILSTLPYNEIDYKNGTSMAAPHVSGVCALLLSINPCLSGKQVRDIIERTSQKVGGYTYSTTAGRPNGTWNNEMGYGLVDAYAAVQLAQAMSSSSSAIDLMVRDGYDDFGIQPNTTTYTLWNSPDIWIRNLADGIDEHQNPVFSPTDPNYVYVRVTNKSCDISSGEEELKLYWSKASSSLYWPSSWDGTSAFPSGAIKGAPIGTITIPPIAPGKEVILRFDWNIPDPALYGSMSDAWHYCLLARIESTYDPMNGSELRPSIGNPNQNDPSNLARNVMNNNNIAWRNLTVVNSNIIANNTGTLNATISVENPFNEMKSYYLELVKEDSETGKNIYDEAEVSIKMSQTLFNAWERGGKEAQRVEATLDENKKIVKGNNVILDKINFLPNETGKLTLFFNFLTKEITDKTQFVYHLIQKDALTNEVLGGETYLIKKPIRNIFVADAGGDKTVDKNETITISASQINETAIYNWYDINGNLIYQGKDLSIATEVAKKYKLEVIATADGFKDYTEVEVKLKPSLLGIIYPNPATSNITISYKLNTVSTAYLIVIGSYGTTGTTNNYILDSNSTETTLNIANYPNGFYTIALVCNGQIVDAKTIIKQ